MKSHHMLTAMVAAVSLSLFFSAPLKAETGADEMHDHGHDEHAASALSLDHGKKWQTDAPLRKGMMSIRHEAMNAADAFHQHALSQSQADSLAKHIHAQVEYLVENCKLEPQADATLHVLIGDLLAGAGALAEQPLSNQGLPRIIKALQLYPDYFEHPGWAAIQHD